MSKSLPTDYVERVYAGVLGKIIGVYLGRPFEGMRYRDVLKNLGPINYYVHERRNVPLVVTDDDISGTFTFVRAMEDYARAGESITAEQIGHSWLNYIIENKTILWWGGMGMSTEHTAFLRLKHGIPAPRSGSIELNSKVVAEQIGSQIFVDGWAMIAPGRPDLAVELARKAASVSHDGEAIYGAQVIAAMEAQAFVEPDLQKLLDLGASFIPKDSVIYRMIADLRNFREKNGDWQAAMTDVMEKRYGYDKYGGNCHMVPNHGLIILALLYGEDDFQKSLMIANTCGWDTDCNSGNVGCLLGIKNGLAAIDAGPDWRSPVADRLFLPTADGGSCINDAVTQTYRLVNLGRSLAGLKDPPLAPKKGARFHFSLPGSTQGFVVEESPECRGVVVNLSNSNGSTPTGKGCLTAQFRHLATGRFVRVGTATFVGQEAAKMGGYQVFATPTLSPGQTVEAAFQLTTVGASGEHSSAVTARFYLRYYGEKDELVRIHSPELQLKAGDWQLAQWKIPAGGGQPIAEVGVELSSTSRCDGALHIDYFTWNGSPEVTLGSLTPSGDMWRKQWVAGVDQFVSWGRTDDTTQAFTAIQNEGRGLAMHGTREWADYTVSATLTPHLAVATGLAVRVQGMRRYYALLLVEPNRAQLVKVLHDQKVLAEAEFAWQPNDEPHAMELTARGNRIIGSIDGRQLFDMVDSDNSFTGGGIAIVIEEGRVCSTPVRVGPA